MKPYAEQFYKSKQWQDCRNSYMKKVGGLCELCLKEGKITPAEEVHHKVHVVLDEHDGDGEHGARKKRYKIDDWGKVTPI